MTLELPTHPLLVGAQGRNPKDAFGHPLITAYPGAAEEVLHTCETTDLWSQNALQGGVSVALDPATYHDGSNSITFPLQTDTSTSRANVNLAANRNMTPYGYIIFWIYVSTSTVGDDYAFVRNHSSGEGSEVYFEASASDNLASPHTSVSMQHIPFDEWVELSYRIETPESLKSFGWRSAGQASAPADSYTIRIDNIRLREVTPLEQSLVANDQVIVPADYAPPAALSQGYHYIRTPKAVLDLRESRAILSSMNGEKWTGSYEIDATGATGVTSDLGWLFRTKISNSANTWWRFPAGATYNCDKDVPFDLYNTRNCKVDWNGAGFGSSYLAAGITNQYIGRATEFIWLEGNKGLELWRPKLHGMSVVRMLGDDTVSVTGAAPSDGTTTSGTARLLDKQNDGASTNVESNASGGVPGYQLTGLMPSARLIRGQHSAITEDGQMLIGVTLSDTAQTASDVKITVYDELGNAVQTSRSSEDGTATAFTVTGSAVEYFLTIGDGAVDLGFRLYLIVTKATTSVNTISVHSIQRYGAPAYIGTADGVTVDSLEYAAGFRFRGASVRWRNERTSIYYAQIEGTGGDGIQISGTDPDGDPQDTLIKGGVYRCAGRQGISTNGGYNTYVEDVTIREAGRSSWDIEPSVETTYLYNVVGSRLKLYNPSRTPQATHPYGNIACTNGQDVYGLRVTDSSLLGSPTTAFNNVKIGAQGGEFSRNKLGEYPGLWRNSDERSVNALNVHDVATNFDVKDNILDGTLVHVGSGKVGGNTINSKSNAVMFWFGPNVTILPGNKQRRQNYMNLNGAHTAGATTVNLVPTVHDLPDTGYVIIGNDTIQYTAKSDTANTITIPGGGIPNSYTDNCRVLYDSTWETEDTSTDYTGNFRPITSTTTSEAINSAATEVAVRNGSIFPSSGTILIGSEIITYGSKTGQDLDLTGRGQHGTTAASQSSGATVTLISSNQVVPPFSGLETAGAKHYSSTHKARTASWGDWPVGGLDLQTEPVVNLKGISTGSTRPNNRHGQGAPGNAVTSLAITFPNQAFNVTPGSTATSTATSGGTLLDLTTYYYKAGGHNIRGGPYSTLTAQFTRTTGNSTANTNTITLTIGDLVQGNYLIQGLTIYRGLNAVPGTYTHRYDWLPLWEPKEFTAGLAQQAVVLKDTGTTLLWTPTSTTIDEMWGYPTETAVQAARTGDPNSGAWTGVNETGWEPDTSYKIYIGDATWSHGGFWITNKNLNGFTVNWVTATADANQRFEWFLER